MTSLLKCIIFGVHLLRVNAEILSAYRIHTIYQILIGSHFVVLYIGGGDGIEQFFCTVNFGSFDGRQIH